MTDSPKPAGRSRILGRPERRRQTAERSATGILRPRTAMAVLAAAALPVTAGSALLVGAAPAQAAQTMSTTFMFDDSTQYFVVPAGVTSLDFTVAGGDGGVGSSGTDSGAVGGAGGLGAEISGTIPVIPGRTLVIEVGGEGGVANSENGGSGGLSSGNLMNGGAGGPATYFVDGFQGGGGGGGTEIVDASTGVPLVAAGGGGGGGGAASIVNDGGSGGNAALPGAQGDGSGGDGGAGAAAGSWAGGDGGSPYPAAESGGGGGGGGGYYDPALGLEGAGNGGGGGGWESYESGGGGGGGGDSYLDPATSGASFGFNTPSRNGGVALSWEVPAPTSTTLTSSASSVTPGQSYELIAAVTGSGTPTGYVQFTSSTGQVLTAALDGFTPDSAAVDVVAPSNGETVTWDATYMGDSGDLTSSSASVAVTVLWPTTIALSANTTVVKKDKSFTLTATVTSDGLNPPTGVVDFYAASGEPIGQALTNGTASIVLFPLQTGSYEWTATYEGDAQNSPSSTATGVTIDVVGAPTVSKVSPPSGSAGTTVTLTGSNLVDVSKVLFGTKAAKDVSCPTESTCTAIAPSGVTGKVNVRVMAVGGESAATKKAAFTFTAAP